MDICDQMDIPQQFPSHSVVTTLKIKSKEPWKKDIEYFKASRGKNDKSVSFKENLEITNNCNRSSFESKQHKQNHLKGFLEFQDSFSKQRQQNISKLKQMKDQQEAKQCTGRPSINSHSRKLTSHVAQPYYHRLSKSKSKIKQQQTNTYIPQISNRSRSLDRQKNVSDILYNDALRRIKKNNVNQVQKSIKDISILQTNRNTDRLISRTLKSQFQQFAANYQQFTPVLSLSILSNLFNVELNPKKDSHTNELCNKINGTLFGKNKNISKQKLWAFIYIVVGNDQSPLFKDDQIKYIKKNLSVLYRNRMTKNKKQLNQNIPTFKPEILKNSERLAQKKRTKLFQQAQKLNLISSQNQNISVPISDLYLMERICKQEDMRIRKIEQEEEKQAKQCTFKPVLTQWKGYKQCIIPSTKSSRKKLEHLRTLSRCENTLQTSKTFISNTSFKDTSRSSERKSLSRDKQRQTKVVKNLQVAVQRMNAARQQRQFTNHYLQRGYPKNVQNYEQYRQLKRKSINNSHEKLKGHTQISKPPPMPPLPKDYIFDIHINTGIIQTIRLRSSDNPLDIVQQLTIKHNLQQGKRQKLFQLIQYHINSQK